MNWTLTQNLTQTTTESSEIWTRGEESFPVSTRFGKKTNLLRLKKEIVSNLKEQVEYYNRSRRGLFSQPDMEEVEMCMVCGAPASEAIPVATVYGAEFVQCPVCSHVYLRKRPGAKAIADFYRSDTRYAATYTSKDVAEFRLESIAMPWVRWTIDTFERAHGRKPRSIVDVGSGAGHFVEACRRVGIEAKGIEISEASCEFAKEVWGIEQDSRDFIDVAGEYEGADVVTFWGLLEHTPNPAEILSKATQVVSASDAGMVLSKLPRWSCLSAGVQTLCPDTIVRHLDPLGHIMCFTDASTAELYYRCGLKPSAAWYFGMDVYETLMQFSHQVGEYAVLTKTGELQMELQQKVDEARFSDNFVIAGLPRT